MKLAPARLFCLIPIAFALMVPNPAASLQRGDILAVSGPNLVAFDPVAGTVSVLANSTRWYEHVAVSPRGTIYAVASRGAAGNTAIVRVDPTTGAETLVYDSRRQAFWRGLAAAPGELLYVLDSSGLLCVDAVTGTVTLPFEETVLDMAIGEAGIVWALQPNRILGVTHHNGITAVVPIDSPLYGGELAMGPGGFLYYLRTDYSSSNSVVRALSERSLSWRAVTQQFTRSTSPFEFIVDRAGNFYVCSIVLPTRRTVPGLHRYSPQGEFAVVANDLLMNSPSSLALYDWIDEPTPTIRTTWGRIKTLYR